MFANFHIVIKGKYVYGFYRQKNEQDKLYNIVKEVLEEFVDDMATAPNEFRKIGTFSAIFNRHWFCEFHLYRDVDVKLDIQFTPLIMDENRNLIWQRDKLVWFERKKNCNFFISKIMPHFRKKGIRSKNVQLKFHYNYGDNIGIYGYIPSTMSVYCSMLKENIGLPLLSTVAAALYLYYLQYQNLDVDEPYNEIVVGSFRLLEPSENISLIIIPFIILIIINVIISTYRVTFLTKELIYEIETES